MELLSEDAHKNHETGVNAGFSHRLHPIISEKRTISFCRITSTQEVKKLLHHYVTITLSNQQGMQHQMYNRVYFPTDTDITNHIIIICKKSSFFFSVRSTKLSGAN